MSSITKTSIICSFTVPEGATPGTFTILVTNLDTKSGSTTLEIVSLQAPTIDSVTPSDGEQATSVDVVIVGTYFRTGAVVSFAAAPAVEALSKMQTAALPVVSNVVVVSSTKITCTVTIAAAVAAETLNIVVTNSDTQEGTASFSVVVAQTPTISTITPSTAGPGQTV